MKAHNNYTLSNILAANDAVLATDIFLVILYANRIPPHLALTINGKLFTLTVKGATVDGEITTLLRTIKKNSIETIFVRLNMPQLFTVEQLKSEIKKYTLAYPRVDVGAATCLAPIKDFCQSVYATDTKNVNFIFDLLPKLELQNKLSDCYHLNMEKYMQKNNFALHQYTLNDIYDSVRQNQLLTN
jgi:hypothetical protein